MTSFKLSKNLFLWSLLQVSMVCSARDYYVDSSADPGGEGTSKNPFVTIQAAATVMKAGDECLIRAGIYSEVIRPSTSGTEDNPILFKALAGGRVVVIGSDPLSTEDWQKVDDHHFRIKASLNLKYENQVFLGKKMLLEARWPNTKEELLDPVLAEMDEGTVPEKIYDSQLPDLDWTGAGVWVHAPKHWANWTTEIIEFEKGSFEFENLAPYPGPKQHVAIEGAEYFLYGCLSALDSENEWYYDEDGGFLYVWRADGKLPQEYYYAKRRMLAFDLSGRSHIHIENIEVNAASISTDESSTHIVLDRMKILHPYHSSEANKYYGTQTDKGVLMMGTNCQIRNCEIAYSSGCGIVLDGKYNLVFNCYIHDTDYIGTYAGCVKLQGKGNIISHCTLSRTGRAVIDYGDMYESLIQYCDMNQGGMLTRDTGLTYGNVIHGGNSEVRYNWLHDNLDDHWDMGLYYDHGTQNILSHHNVIWGIDHFGFMINHYGYFHQVYNNTFIAGLWGFRSTWGNQYEPDLYGCRIYNNIFSAYCETTADNLSWGNNIQGYKDIVDNKYLPIGSTCIDSGINIPGITDGFKGEAPDLGAYEKGKPHWKAGHDFDKPPKLDTNQTLTKYRNRIENSAFEHQDHLLPWIAVGKTKLQQGRKGQTTPDIEKYRMGSWSIELGKDGEIYQRIEDLEPDSEYQFSAFVRVDNEELVLLGVVNSQGREELSPTMEGNAPGWNRLILNFRTGLDQREARIFVRRLTSGTGEAFVDDTGLILVGMQ